MHGLLTTAQQGANLAQILHFTYADLLKALLGSGPRYYLEHVIQGKETVRRLPLRQMLDFYSKDNPRRIS